MGVLLREALRTMCVNNQWSYAVFWKIGCQNANLLIWEECYYEPLRSSLPPRISGISSSRFDSQVDEKVHLLINRMMLNSRIILVGEGLVGRAAFTENPQWILANNYNREAHPPEVVNEMLVQFSTGMQTVAVIPILPHGVVQFGSHLPIMENLGFVNDVKSLILQLGCIPGALFSENYGVQDYADLVGVSLSPLVPSEVPMKASNLADETCKQKIFNSSESLKFTGQDFSMVRPNQDNSKVTAFTNPIRDRMRRVNFENPFEEQKQNVFLGAEVIPSKPDAWVNRDMSSLDSSGNQSNLGFVEQQILSCPGFQENDANVNVTNTSNTFQERNEGPSSRSFDLSEERHTQSSLGNDLFDMLGLDSNSKALDDGWSNSQIDGLDVRAENLTKELCKLMNIQEISSDIYSGYEYSGTDNLLDAVVSGACSSSKQISDDTESCRTTLTKLSNSSVNNNTSNGFQGGFYEIPKAETSGTVGSSCFRSGFGKDNTGTCSKTTSVYGSQISSWVEQAHSVKRENSVSTAYSKMKNETPKPNKKRLKPGENPRPRPKDRQMIQDRVKELREIIPNGAKCSIDALLERTIKHMLFLQSVSKHSDKLKQIGEPKIINKEVGLLRKDNFEGGATWAFEVGSQSMVCPIVVEDLSPPRNFLVEMLCEERGFFLEIADWIRGLGLTILKGVMEARNDRIWARFAVEANRDITRMEIFMSLVNLLEQTMKCVGPTGNILEGINGTIGMNSLPQAASIPVTGGCSM